MAILSTWYAIRIYGPSTYSSTIGTKKKKSTMVPWYVLEYQTDWQYCTYRYTCTYSSTYTCTTNIHYLKNNLKYKHSGATVGVVSIEGITVYYS